MIEAPKRLSYSSLSSYMECGERWRLERGYGLNKSTWFATVAGSAIHAITEAMDLQEIGLYEKGYARFEPDDLHIAWGGEIPTFEQEFTRLLDIEAEKGIEVKPSGKVTKSICKSGGPNKKDYAWWLEMGPPMVENWATWKAEEDLTLAVMPDGSPGVEVRLDVDVAGRRKLGFIDRVYLDGDLNIRVVDLKAGEVPKSKLQLGDYRVGLLKQYDLDAIWGAYWMAKDGELTPWADLTVYSEPYLESLYDQAWRGIEAGIFLPNVTALCNGCGVKDHCRAVGGRHAIAMPIREKVVQAVDTELTTSE